MEYNSTSSFVLVFNLDDSHLHKKGSHGSSRLVCIGLVVVVGFEVVTSIPIKVLDFFNPICTFLG